MNIFKIAHANIKKRKGSSIAFLVMVFLAGIMLSMSLSLMMGSTNFFENKVNELNAPHYSSFIVEGKYDPAFKTFAEGYAGHSASSELDALFGTGSWQMKSGTVTHSLLFMNYVDTASSFFKPTLIDKLAVGMSDKHIILPISFKFGGFKSGESINLDLDGPKRDFVIYAFYEDAIAGSSVDSVTLAYFANDGFAAEKASGNFMGFKGLMVRFDKSETNQEFATAFRKHAKLNENEVFEMTYAGSESSATMFMNIVSMFLIVFSVIILVIAFIVVMFSITSSIAEDIANIGALKSMGYRNSTLRGSQLMQYLMIAIVGAVFGSLVSLLVFGLLGNIIASTSGLLWLSSTNILPAVISTVAICGLTLLVSLFATRKYKTVTPIAALRQGSTKKASEKNVMPLERGKLPLNVQLGFKRFFNSVKNNITLGITVTLLVFVSLLVFVMSYNMNIDRTAMINMVGLEMSDIYLQASYGVNIEDVNADIKTHDAVEWTMLAGGKFGYIGEHETVVYTVEDYTKLTMNTVVKGRNPSANDEVALGSVTADIAKKKIGDTISIEIDDAIKDYKVVGITQNIGNGGEGCNITYEAMRTHATNYEMSQINIYLKSDANAKEYMANLKTLYGSQVIAMDVNEAMDTILSSMGDPLGAVSVIMIIITLIIIGFVLFLITSALIRKNKKEFGIMKAIGYRNRALIFQLFLSLLPALLFGTIAGTLLGFFISNPLLSVFFSSAGLLKTYFIIPTMVSIIISLGVFLASVAITYLIAFRLRTISPQKLITAQ